MKKLLLVMMLILALALAACSAEEPAASGAIVLSNMDAAEIADAFVQAGLPITNIVVYSEETDVYNALGRAEQFTSKVLFADSRLDQSGAKAPLGGSIEVFKSPDLAAARAGYIELLFDIMPEQGEYIYLIGNVLLRVDRTLMETDAAAYQAVLQGLDEGQLVKLNADTPSDNNNPDHTNNNAGDNADQPAA